MRETVQNAMDACKIQLWRDLKDQKYDAWLPEERRSEEGLRKIAPFEIDGNIFENYNVEVKIEDLDSEHYKITVSDNGVGITIEELKEICHVGESYYGREQRKKEIAQMPEWLKPTAGFGIGLQSIFLVSDTFDMVSKTEKGEFKATSQSGKVNGYVQVMEVENSEKRNRKGTDVIVKVKRSDGYSGYASSYEYDPFDGEYDIGKSEIIGRLEEYCRSTYFNFVINETGLKEDVISRQKFEGRKEEGWQEKGNYKYKLDDNLSIRLWDMECMANLELELSYRGDVEICFKGMHIEDYFSFERYGIRHFDIRMDLYGFDTKETITLDRSSIRTEKKEEVRKIAEKASHFYREIL